MPLLDTALVLACLGAGLALTDRAMQANLRALPAFARPAASGAAPRRAGPGDKVHFVRMDAAFWQNFAGPLLLQGALTTVYCFAVYLVTAVAVTAGALAFLSLRRTAAAATTSLLQTLATPRPDAAGFLRRFVAEAVRAVLSNGMDATRLLLLAAAVQAAAVAVCAAGMAAYARVRKPSWTFTFQGVRYVGVAAAAAASRGTTASAFAAVCTLLFSRTRLAAQMLAAVVGFCVWLFTPRRAAA